MSRFRDETNSLYRDYATHFYNVLERNPFLPEVQVHQIALQSPAPCWYCSPENAMRMTSGNKKFGANKLKEKKYIQLAEVIANERTLHPDMFLIDLVSEIVNSQAPSFFISISTAKRIILKHRKSKRKFYERFKIPTRSY